MLVSVSGGSAVPSGGAHLRVIVDSCVEALALGVVTPLIHGQDLAGCGKSVDGEL